MSAGTRVLLVDDDEFTRFLLVRALASFGYDEAVACDGAPAAVVAAETLRPHVAILDLDLGPGPSGIDLAHALRRKQPDLAIILLTSFEDPRLLVGSAALPSGTSTASTRAHLCTCRVGGALLGAERCLLPFTERFAFCLVRSLCQRANSNLIRDTTPT